MADEKNIELEKKKIEEEESEEPSASEERMALLRRRSSSREDDSPTRSAESDEDFEGEGDFDSLFTCFARFGDRKSTEIALRSVDKWFAQADLFDDNLSTTDTAITFAKVAKNKKKLSKEEFEEMLKQLAEDKGMEVEEIKGKLGSCGRPSFTRITKTVGGTAAETVRRLTDTSGYTGTHRERFDEEGRGRGLEGRHDSVENDGYVTGFRRSSEGKK